MATAHDLVETLFYNIKKEREKYMEKVLLKDIVIPKGTVFRTAPVRTDRSGNDHYDCTIGLTKNSCGDFTYCIDDPKLEEWFTDLK